VLLGPVTALAAAPKSAEAGVSADVGQGGGPAGPADAADAAPRPRLPPALHRKGAGGGLEAVRGGLSKVLRVEELRQKNGSSLSSVEWVK